MHSGIRQCPTLRIDNKNEAKLLKMNYAAVSSIEDHISLYLRSALVARIRPLNMRTTSTSTTTMTSSP